MSLSLCAVYLDESGSEPMWRDIRSTIPSRNDELDDAEDLNLSNGNMASVFRALGLDIDSGGALIPVDQFLRSASVWLQQNLDAPSPAREPITERGSGGAVMIDLGLRAGYLNERIHQAVLVAQKGRALGATHISAH